MPSVFARPNKFNLSHTNSLTCDMGALVPFLVQEVLPGDEFRIKTDALVRLAPMLAPVFGEIDLYTHYFFVPNRLLWTNWENFITNGLAIGTDSSVKPYIRILSPSASLAQPGTLLDYLGYPVGDSAGTNGASVSDPFKVRLDALPLMAYNKIYNDWYLNEFVGSERANYDGDGERSLVNANHKVEPSLAYRCWPRDYFTSCNPFVQLGSPVTLGIGCTAPVVGTGKALGLTDGSTTGGFYVQGSPAGTVAYDSTLVGEDVGTSATSATGPVANKAVGVSTDSTKSGLVADLTSASAVTINDLRTAFQLQRILERKARSGNRYVEYLASSFGVRSPDARLQRAEFLGGGKSPIMISEVLQTSSGTETSPQGNMSGHGFGASRSFSVNKAFTEHGYIMGILSIMPKTSYFQGRPKSLCRWSWTDYAQPEFYHLGEQAVYKSELLCNSTTAGDNTFDNGEIFGYQPRYEEYRRCPSEVHGDFRTNMSYWHLARIFSSTPALNADFVNCVPSKRIFAAGDLADRPCWVYMNLDIRAIRPLSKKGAPGLVDH